LLAKGKVSVIFFPISVRFGTNLSRVIFAALTARLADLHNTTLPGQNTSAEEWRGLMLDYLVRPVPEGKQVVLIIDGADEAADWKFAEDFFPFNPPKGLRVVLSTRHGTGNMTTTFWLRTLGWDRVHLAKKMELSPLSHEGIADVLQRMGFPLDVLGERVDIVAQLHRLSEGDPLLVRLYVDDLWTKGESVARLQPEDLQKIRPGIENYFKQWWENQRELLGNQSPIRESTGQAVFNILSCAFGPLDQRDILRLAPAETQLNTWSLDEALRLIQRFVIGDDHQQGYAFSHPRLGNYFYGELGEEDRRKYEERFLTWGQETVQALKEERISPDKAVPYILQYYGAHLTRARCQPTAFLALVSNGWKKAWENLEGTYAGFLSDVDQAWHVAEDAGQKAAEDNQRIPYIGGEVRCALCHTSIHSLAANLPSAFLVALVEKNILTPVQAWNYAHHTSNEWQREETIVGLAPHLLESLLVEAFEEARTIERSASRAEAFVALIPQLSDGFKEAALREALQAAQQTDNDFARARILVRLAPHAQGNLEEILQLAYTIGDGFSRADALRELARYVPGEAAGKILQDALQAVRSIDDGLDKAEALTAVSPQFPGNLKEKLLQESLDIVSAIVNNFSSFRIDDIIADILAGMAPHLTVSASRKALEIARTIQEESYRVQALVRLASRRPQSVKRQMLQKVAQIIQTTSGMTRIEALIHVGPYLKESVVKKVLQAAQLNLETSYQRAKRGLFHSLRDPEFIISETQRLATKAWARLSRYLPQDSKEQVATESLKRLQEVDDEFYRASALVILAPYLPPLSHKIALQITQAIENEKERGRALASLSPYLVEPLLREAFQDAVTIGDRFSRSDASWDLASHLTGKSKLPVGNRLSQEMRSIRDAFPDGKALASQEAGPVRKLLTSHALQQALHEVLQIKFAHIRCKELTSLLPHLPEDVGEAILRQELHQVPDPKFPGEKVKVLEYLAPCLPDSLLDDALTVARDIKAASYRAEALSMLVPRLFDRQKEEVLEEILQIVKFQMNLSSPAVGSLLSLVERLASHISATSYYKWKEVVSSCHNVYLRIFATATLVLYFPEHLKTEILRETLPVACAFENPTDRAWTLAELIPHLPQDQKEEILCKALQTAGKIENEWFRVPVLAKLAPHLTKLPHHILYPVWQATLHVLATRTRRAFVGDLGALSPVLLTLGGNTAIEETIQAMEDVGQWWP
jgi:hypothetical protein